MSKVLTDLQGVYRRSGRVQDVTNEFRSDGHNGDAYLWCECMYIGKTRLVAGTIRRGPICTHLSDWDISSSLRKSRVCARAENAEGLSLPVLTRRNKGD